MTPTCPTPTCPTCGAPLSVAPTPSPAPVEVVALPVDRPRVRSTQRVLLGLGVLLVVVAGLVFVVAGALTAATLRGNTAAAPAVDAMAGAAAPVVRDSSHRLSTAPDGKVTFVEFLDFECEGCRAVYPVIEQLRTQYEGRVTFVIRYFPIDSHKNAMNAAVAVEAAARQGELEAMYARMYETQAEWGEQSESRAPLFRQFAEQLGLDLNPSGCVRVDEFGRTSVPGVTAGGDLAHLAVFPMPMASVVQASAAGQIAGNSAIGHTLTRS